MSVKPDVPPAIFKYFEERGRRKSPSMYKTFNPDCAMEIARFTEVVVLPSPGKEEERVII